MKLIFYYSNVFAAAPVVVAKAPNIVASTHLMFSFTLVQFTVEPRFNEPLYSENCIKRTPF